ncbi:MAG: serine/threonine protein kinase [Lentisphaeria bacterium]|nr:serine/threonine protein kinase [Lentisphaeria bacterium]
MKEAVSNDFAAMMFCPSCRSKLAVPLEMLDGSNISCPRCEASFLPETESLMAEDSSGIFDEEETGAGEEKRIFEDGAFFDKYKIIKILGKGGMAEVYLAEHLLLKQLCALKLMRPSLYDSNPRFIKRFIREAKITHRIKHPNIVSVFDVGSDQKTGYLFIAMEFLDGKSLLETSRDRLLSERDLLDMALSMTSALSVLEKEKVVHRDIKPSNIMFCKNGTLKLMDLGVAKAESGSMEGEITLTVEQTSIGTPSYASPEQCECAHNVDTRSDIYCLGATLYHAASGHVPFGGGTPFEIMLKVLREEPVPLVRYRSDLSRHFLALINDMMQKDPNKRPSSAAVLEKRVKECIAYLENPASVQALSLLPPLGLNNEKSIKEPERKNTHYPALAPHLPDNASGNGNGAFSHTLADLPPPAVEEDEIELPGIKMSGSASNSSTILPKMIFAGENESSSVKKKESERKKQVRIVGQGGKLTGLITTFTGKMQQVEKFVLPYLKSTVILNKAADNSRKKEKIILVVLMCIIVILLIALLVVRSNGNGPEEMESEQFRIQEVNSFTAVEEAAVNRVKEVAPVAVTGKKTSGDNSGEKPEVESVRYWYTSENAVK